MPVNWLMAGLLVPTAVSLAIAWGMLRCLPPEVSRRCAAAIGYAGGFLGGFALFEPQNLRPSTYWHWLPWMAVAAAIIGPIAVAPGVRAAERWALTALLSLAAAWLLVPTWPDLQPGRSVYIAMYAGGVFLVSSLLDGLIPRVSAALLLGVLGLASACSAVLLAALVSLRFGLLAAAATAALAGGLIAAIRNHPEALRGLLPGYAALLGGLMLAGQVNVGLPPVCFVLIPAAPVALWTCEFGPVAKLRGKSAILARLAAVSLPLALAWGLALQATRSDQTW